MKKEAKKKNPEDDRKKRHPLTEPPEDPVERCYNGPPKPDPQPASKAKPPRKNHTNHAGGRDWRVNENRRLSANNQKHVNARKK